MKNFLGILGNALLWFVTVLLVLLVTSGICQHYLNKGNYSGLFGVGYAVVVSGSMEPNIHINDMIIYRDHPSEEYRVGDCIVYVREDADGETLITHRIVAIDGDSLTTQGDANNVPDDPVSFDRVVGRIVWRIPTVGKAVSFLKTPLGSGISVGAVVLIIVLNLLLTRDFSRRHEVRTAQGTQIIKY